MWITIYTETKYFYYFLFYLLYVLFLNFKFTLTKFFTVINSLASTTRIHQPAIDRHNMQ